MEDLHLQTASYQDSDLTQLGTRVTTYTTSDNRYVSKPDNRYVSEPGDSGQYQAEVEHLTYGSSYSGSGSYDDCSYDGDRPHSVSF